MELIQIGIIKTPFSDSKGTPIQPSSSSAAGVVHIFEQYADALQDLDGFDRIWLIFWCDQAKPAQMRVIPYMDNVPRGLFATRSPSRPNPIGISCVKVRNILGLRLQVSEVDMLNNTPLLDIKPYVPQFDAYWTMCNGWIDNINQQKLTTGKADKRFQNT